MLRRPKSDRRSERLIGRPEPARCGCSRQTFNLLADQPEEPRARTGGQDHRRTDPQVKPRPQHALGAFQPVPGLRPLDRRAIGGAVDVQPDGTQAGVRCKPVISDSRPSLVVQPSQLNESGGGTPMGRRGMNRNSSPARPVTMNPSLLVNRSTQLEAVALNRCGQRSMTTGKSGRMAGPSLSPAPTNTPWFHSSTRTAVAASGEKSTEHSTPSGAFMNRRSNTGGGGRLVVVPGGTRPSNAEELFGCRRIAVLEVMEAALEAARVAQFHRHPAAVAQRDKLHALLRAVVIGLHQRHVAVAPPSAPPGGEGGFLDRHLRPAAGYR